MTWGKGSIPAHAGQPTSRARATSPRRVDPRACGAARNIRSRAPLATGRSPRMRGSPDRRARSLARRGSIPAHAGQPARPIAAPTFDGVDPRACGAASMSGSPSSAGKGRSPRMRGSQVKRTSRPAAPGSIPAHAGQPRPRHHARERRGVDPRACGAAWTVHVYARSVRGRSPRMRGSLLNDLDADSPRGSIPAHAGQPAGGIVTGKLTGVDPRACGAA